MTKPKTKRKLELMEIATHLDAKWIQHLRKTGQINDKVWEEAEKLKLRIDQDKVRR